jgi:hypothetical protein
MQREKEGKVVVMVVDKDGLKVDVSVSQASVMLGRWPLQLPLPEG